LDREAADRAIDAALSLWRRFPAPVQRIERERCWTLLRELVELETRRTHHTIEAVEVPTSFALSGLDLEFRIDRIDRVGDSRLVLDYKTGRSARALEPADPQLALYALSLPDATGVCHVRLIPGDCSISGAASSAAALAEPGTPGLRVDAGDGDWTGRLATWRETLAADAHRLVSGDVRVAPVDRSACTDCGLAALCRIRWSRHDE
jgi:hypothetical protein